MTPANHFLAADGGTRPACFALFDDPRYAQLAFGRAKEYPSAAPSRTSAPLNECDDGLPVKFAARAAIPDERLAASPVRKLRSAVG